MTTDELLIRLALINLATIGPLLLIGLLFLYWRLLRSSGRRAEVTRTRISDAEQALTDHVTAEVGARTAEVRLLVVTESQKTASVIGDAIVELGAKLAPKPATPRPRATPRTSTRTATPTLVPALTDATKASAASKAAEKPARKRSSK